MDIIIVGMGRVGTQLTRELSKENHNVTAIDLKEKVIDKIIEKYDVQGITGNGTLVGTLESAEVKACDLFISATPYDEDNILACLIANRLGAKNTVARVRNPEYLGQSEFMREELGISLMINPEFSTALEIFRLLQFPNAMDVESFANGRIDMAEIKITKDSPLCNMKLSQIPSEFSKDLLICAVCRGDEVYIPNGNFVIEEGDSIHFTGSHKQLGKVARVISGSKKEKPIKSIMLIGASRISTYLANLLVNAGKEVTVVERNEDNAKKLIDHCKKVDIILSDANNYDVLIEEGLDNMDAVVTLTDADETNILISMVADSLGVTKTITKVNDPNLSSLIEKAENGTTVSVPETTCDILVQYARAKKNISSSYMRTLYKLVDGKIEAAEFEVQDYVKFIGKPLSTLKIKDNVLVAAVNRNNKIFFPSGNDVIERNDIVVVVSKGYSLSNLNDILK